MSQDNVEAIKVPIEGFKTSKNILTLSKRFIEPGETVNYWRANIPKIMGMKDCKPTKSFHDKSEFDFGEAKLLPIHTYMVIVSQVSPNSKNQSTNSKNWR